MNNHNTVKLLTLMRDTSLNISKTFINRLSLAHCYRAEVEAYDNVLKLITSIRPITWSGLLSLITTMRDASASVSRAYESEFSRTSSSFHVSARAYNFCLSILVNNDLVNLLLSNYELTGVLEPLTKAGGKNNG